MENVLNRKRGNYYGWINYEQVGSNFDYKS